MKPSLVAIGRARSAAYPESAPFHPGARYPEAPFEEVSAAPNPAYDAVREALLASGCDRSRAGTPANERSCPTAVLGKESGTSFQIDRRCPSRFVSA